MNCGLNTLNWGAECSSESFHEGEFAHRALTMAQGVREGFLVDICTACLRLKQFPLLQRSARNDRLHSCVVDFLCILFYMSTFWETSGLFNNYIQRILIFSDLYAIVYSFDICLQFSFAYRPIAKYLAKVAASLRICLRNQTIYKDSHGANMKITPSPLDHVYGHGGSMKSTLPVEHEHGHGASIKTTPPQGA